jgi:hypothetical protein
MADGCNLYFTEKDLEKVEESLYKGSQFEDVKTASNILNGRLKNDVDDFKVILADPHDPRHEIVQQLLEKSLSNGKLTKNDEWKLPKALKTVLDIQKNPQGLFERIPKYRGAGSSKMQHGGELLTTAAIIQKGGIPSSSGKKLYIDNTTDKINFGQKLPSKYVSLNKNKDTIEADTYIERDKGILRGVDVIGIDTKYSKSSSNFSIKDRAKFEKQLNGIQNCFRDGNLQEFYFVSNVKFSGSFKDTVQEYNIKIFKERLSEDSEMRNEFGRYLSSKEKETYIPKEFEKFDFAQNPDSLKEIARKYDVPQIGICEEVTYKS